MTRLISTVFLLIFVTCYLNVTTGYKWVTVKEGDELPNNTITVIRTAKVYVGRIVHYNLILPATVIGAYAVAFNPITKARIETKQFEILTASEKCEWKELNDLTDVPENVVRVGRTWNREPIYLGAIDKSRVFLDDIASIFLTSNKFFPESSGYGRYALVCVSNAIWVKATPPTIPKNAITINEKNFVARLMGPHSLVPAYIRNDSYYCSSLFNDIEINSLTCQVLVGTSNSSEYSWKQPGPFERIPEYAVAQGRTGSNELIYVSRDAFKSLSLITFSKVASVKYFYEVLVKNVV